MIRAVMFDVGECLIDETREYGTWADWLDVPRHTFSSVFGSVIAGGGDYRDTFAVFAPGFDLDEQRAARAAAGRPEHFDETNLYGDVRPALSGLRAQGLWVGIAGNQTKRAGDLLRSMNLPADSIVTSDDLGVEKPAVGFFEAIAEIAGRPANEILYVGDRLDNDIRPAAQYGMATAWIRRGPWATIQQHHTDAHELPTMRIDSLSEISDRLSVLSS